MFYLIECGESLSNEIIDAFEKELNLGLPRDYKMFMLKNNGGMPEDDVVFDYYDVVSESTKRAVIQEFYILYPEENYEIDNIKNICKGFWEDRFLSNSMFAIGSDPAGNIICISLSDDDYGAVYLCNHEYEDINTGYMMASKVADSFDEFLKATYTLED
jgi:hypothetical protein